MKYYKVLRKDGRCYHGGQGVWSLPTKRDDGTWEPGEWMPEIEGELVACENGYHLCRLDDLLGWLGPTIYEVEYDGDMVETDDKIVVRRARLLRRCKGWNKRTSRLFACSCAARVLPLFEDRHPEDDRPRMAIETARHYANGEATREELIVARDAAWSARNAARDAAWSARNAAGITRAAAGAAADAPSWEAAWSARNAARAAAAAADAPSWEAAWSARVVAGITRAAAWDAERNWQQGRLAEMLG